MVALAWLPRRAQSLLIGRKKLRSVGVLDKNCTKLEISSQVIEERERADLVSPPNRRVRRCGLASALFCCVSLFHVPIFLSTFLRGYLYVLLTFLNRCLNG